MQESNQIIQLLNNENTTFKNISYLSVDRIKLIIIVFQIINLFSTLNQ